MGSPSGVQALTIHHSGTKCGIQPKYGSSRSGSSFVVHHQPTLTLPLRLHVRRQPSLGRRQCETKTSASGASLYKIITQLPQLHPQRRVLGKGMPRAQLLKSRVCHKPASPIVAWPPPTSCTSRIPKQHSFDPSVRGQIRNMHPKFPVMSRALFRPSVQSMLLCQCYCLPIRMIRNIMPRCAPFHEIWPDDHT